MTRGKGATGVASLEPSGSSSETGSQDPPSRDGGCPKSSLSSGRWEHNRFTFPQLEFRWGKVNLFESDSKKSLAIMHMVLRTGCKIILNATLLQDSS